MKPNEIISYVANGLTYVVALSQTNEVFQLVELILSIATTLFILGINIYSWWKKAKADGKITSDEVEELVEIVGEHGDKLTKRKDK